jgi:hypothetical protein
MLAKPAKVNDTPALGVQLDLLLQPMYTKSYTRQNKGVQVREERSVKRFLIVF